MTVLTTEAFVDQLLDTFTAQGVTFDDLAATKTAAVSLFTGWLGGDNAIPADLGRKLTTQIGVYNAEVLARYDFWTVPAAGGPHGDGTYDLVLPDGTTTQIPGLAKMLQSTAKGDPGGVAFTWSSTTTDGDPGAGGLRYNSGTISSVSKLFFDLTEVGGVDVTAWLESFDDSATTGAKGYLYITQADTPAKWSVWAVTGAVETASGYRKVPVAYLGGVKPTAAARVAVSFVPAGVQGASFLYGSGAPSGGLGTDGDTYLNITNGDFYGPKAAGAWGSPASSGLSGFTAAAAASQAAAETARGGSETAQAAAEAAQAAAIAAAQALGYVEAWTSVAGLTKQSATGTNPSTFTVTQVGGGGLDIVLSSQATICLYPTRFSYAAGGRSRYRATWSPTAITGTNCRAGLSVGAAGANVTARRHYIYRGDGMVYRVGDANSGATVLLAADASRVYGVGDTVSLQLDVTTGGVGTLTITKPNGATETVAVGEAIPDGVVWINTSTQGTVRFASLSAERVASYLVDDMAAQSGLIAANTANITTLTASTTALQAKAGASFSYGTTTGLEVERTLDGLTTGLTYSSAGGGGLSVSVSSSYVNRIYCFHNGYTHTVGVDRFALAATVSTISGSTVAVGISVGAGYGESGTARVTYLLRSDGTLFSISDAEVAGTVFLSTDSRLAFTAPATVGMELEVDETGAGTLTAIGPTGTRVAVAVTGVPLGKAWAAWRGYGAGVISSLGAQGYPSMLKPTVAAVTGLQSTVVQAARTSVGDGTDTLAGVPSFTLEQAISGAALSSVVVSAASPGVRFAATVADSFSALPTGHVYRGGEASYVATVLVNSMTSLWAGLTFGEGTAKRTYAYSNSGAVFWTPWSFANNAVLSSSSTRDFTAGDTVTIRMDIAADQSAVITVTEPGGATFSGGVTGVPLGPVALARRGVADCTFTQLAVSTLPAKVVERIEAVEAAVAAARPDGYERLQGQVEALERLAGLTRVRAPLDFGFEPDFAIYRKADGSFAYGYDHKSRRPCSEVSADHVYYVAPDTGSDSNAGTAAAPFATLGKALDGVTGSVLVRVKTGLWDQSKGLNGVTIAATAVAIEGWGAGKAVFSAHFAGLSWSAVSGNPGVYQATLPGTMVGRVWDASHLDGAGLYSSLTARSNLSQVAATADSWWLDGTTLYVRTFDSRAPDSAIRVYKDISILTWAVPGGVLWLDRVALEGGAYALHAAWTGATRGDLYARDGWARYAYTAPGGVSIDGPIDCVFERFPADKNRLDGHNYHGDGSAANAPTSVELDSGSTGNGYSGGSNNSSTTHNLGLVIRVSTAAGSAYKDSEKRTIHDIETCRSWNLGLTVGASRTAGEEGASIVAGHPTTSPDASRMWLDSCTILAGSPYALMTYQTAVIYAYNLTRNGVSDYAGANVVAWTPEDEL